MSYLNLPGTSGAYASTPDSVALSITGDIDIRCKVALADWTPADTQYLVAKRNNNTPISYNLAVLAGGTLTARFSSNGAANAGEVATSSVATGILDGQVKWVRVTRAASSGVVKFYLSDDGTTWAQLGTDRPTNVGSIVDTAVSLAVGASSDATLSGSALGRIYSAELRNGINGTIVASPNFAAQPAGTTSFADAHGNTWSVNGTASIIFDGAALPLFVHHYRQQGMM